MSLEVTITGRGPFRYAITIPSNAANGTSLLALLVAAGYTGPGGFVVKITPKAPNSNTDRAAFVAANPRFTFTSGPTRLASPAIAVADFTTHGQYVPAGELYTEPADSDAADTYLRSTDASTVSALAVVVF